MRRSSTLAVAAVAAAGLILGGCGTGDADDAPATAPSGNGAIKTGPGVDSATKTIRVGDLNALSGPAAALGKPVVSGHKAFFEALNARGGVDGWKIELAVEDTGYQPQQHVQAFNQLKGDIALLNSFGSPTTKAIQPMFKREKLVTVPASFDSIWGTDPTVAPVGTPYSIDVANALDHVTEGGSKKLKVGIIYQNDEYGADGLRGFEAAKDALGFTDAGRQPYKSGDTDFTAQVQKLKAAGAEAVVLTALPSATGPIVGTAATLGFTPQWILQGPSYIEQLITKDGTADAEPTPVAGALKGAIVTSFSSPWGDDGAPGMNELIADQKKYAPEQTPSIYFALAYAQGKLVEQILAKAIAVRRPDPRGHPHREAEPRQGRPRRHLAGRDLHAGGRPAVPRVAHHGDRPHGPRLPEGGRARPRQRGRGRDRHLAVNDPRGARSPGLRAAVTRAPTCRRGGPSLRVRAASISSAQPRTLDPARCALRSHGKEGVAGSSPAEGFGSAASIASVPRRSLESPRPLRVHVVTRSEQRKGSLEEAERVGRVDRVLRAGRRGLREPAWIGPGFDRRPRPGSAAGRRAATRCDPG